MTVKNIFLHPNSCTTVTNPIHPLLSLAQICQLLDINQLCSTQSQTTGYTGISVKGVHFSLTSSKPYYQGQSMSRKCHSFQQNIMQYVHSSIAPEMDRKHPMSELLGKVSRVSSGQTGRPFTQA